MSTMDEVDYEIIGDDLQFVKIELDPNEAVVGEAGSMMYIEDGIQTGLTWPTTLDIRVNGDQRRFRDWLRARRTLPVMRLDHVLVSRTGAAVREVRTIRIPGTDHRGVLAVIDLPPGGGQPAA